MCNEMVRKEMKKFGVYSWQVADFLGVAESTFYRWMRHELPENRRKEVLAAVRRARTE